ncbi:SRPBCC domain-containing protein [Muricauda sp. NFXS6]|uniref:SRPBCC family protein n=1 Tax=Allomuricauda sp. NFXS6 TaxID=2819094 RepID=UPI0032E04A41
MDKVIVETATLSCNREVAFQMFTENEHLENWLTNEADVELKIGGKYELFWEPNNPEDNSTIGCKVLGFERLHYILFEWKGPKQYKSVMNDVRPLTQVIVFFREVDNKTKVTLIHSGWRDSKVWEEARQYFVQAWSAALKQLEVYCK